jgi:hypothetical protein
VFEVRTLGLSGFFFLMHGNAEAAPEGGIADSHGE